MHKFILKVIKNPIIGPIVVSSLLLSLLTIFYLPHLFVENEKNKIIKESTTIVTHLKTFRTYYDDFVVSKVQAKTDISINYDHEIASNTIPLPATTIHNLSQKLPQSEGVLLIFLVIILSLIELRENLILFKNKVLTILEKQKKIFLSMKICKMEKKFFV